MTIHQTLKQLGLNEKEVKVYLALLKCGKTKPSTLAKFTKLNRATLYNVASGLLSKGIIAEDMSGPVLHLSPLSPGLLGKILEQPKRELHEKELLVKNAIRELNLITAEKTYPVPKIRLIEGSNLEKYLFDNTEKWQQAIIDSDGIWWGYQDQSFAEMFEKWIDYTWKTAPSKHPHYKPQFFSNDTDIEKKLGKKYSKDKRDIKYLSDTDFTANTWVCGTYLVLIMTHQHPFYLIEIHDEMIAHNTKEIFKKLWEVLK
jgi:sugar-specific transcriptional regulator TrmB